MPPSPSTPPPPLTVSVPPPPLPLTVSVSDGGIDPILQQQDGHGLVPSIGRHVQACVTLVVLAVDAGRLRLFQLAGRDIVVVSYQV